MKNETKNNLPEIITIPEIKVIVSGETESRYFDNSELPPPPPQISILD
jgi:hypothetical protein